MIVLDTHAWVWWLADPRRLGNAARKAIDEAEGPGSIAVSSISVWELALLVSRGRIELQQSLASWLGRAEEIERLRFVPVGNAIAVDAVTLPGDLHADPADRIIAATARHLAAPLVTIDERLRAYAHVRTIW